MPELPEVEAVVRALHKAIAGKTIDKAVNGNSEEKTLKGQTIKAVIRRAKYICIELETVNILLHLRLTGAILLNPSKQIGKRKASIVFTDGNEITLDDVRGFATCEILSPAATQERFTALGLEPIDPRFDGMYLHTKLANKRTAIKSALLDQSIAAGVGNIYADEALWHTRTHPLTPSKDLKMDDTKRLAVVLREVLVDAIDAGGSSVNDYMHIDGSTGSYQDQLKAYGRGRSKQPCFRCQRPMAFTKVAGRGTSYCPNCQKRTLP